MNVSVIGQGYVGFPLAIAATQAGHDVWGIDSSEEVVEKINKGISPIREISDEELVQVLRVGKYRASKDFAEVFKCDVVLICVPTPLDSIGKPDLSYLISAVTSVSKELKSGALVINESTVSPGTTRGLIKNILDNAQIDYDLAYSPERIDPGNITWNIANTPKLVSGISQNATERASAFYKTFVQNIQVGSSMEVIETAKLLENSFRLVNISFINELAQFCSALKIDVREVISAAATKPYGFMPFYPSVGIGGHCIPVDPSYLASKARELGVPTRFIELANEFNRSLPAYFTEVAIRMLGNLTNKKILIIGIAYKAGVPDIRETPAAGLISELRSKGAIVSWHDELVKEWMGEKSAKLSSDYDLVILANPHTKTDLSQLGSVRILDTRGGY